MITLPTVNDTLEVQTSTTSTTDYSVEYADITTTAFTPGSSIGQITAAGSTQILGAPGASTQRQVKAISITNIGAGVQTVYVNRDSSATNRRLTGTYTLQIGESLQYMSGRGWYVLDAQGQEKRVTLQGTVDPSINGFRLSPVTGTPIKRDSAGLVSNIFFTPYKSNRIALYDGTQWQLYTTAEITLAVTGRTADLPFDIFAYASGGVVTLEMVNWAGATARTTGIVRQDGVRCKSGDLTRRYIGTCRPRSATQYQWSPISTDAPVRMDLWNQDNREDVAFCLTAGTNTWTYTTATWRQAQGSTNYQVDVVVGNEESSMVAELRASSRNSTISIPRQVGIGLDSTTAFSNLYQVNAATANTVASIEAQQSASFNGVITIGRHFLAWLEISTATGTCTWIGDDGALRLQSGMNGVWNC